ncbi:hypothetical protein JIN84_20635 [Luteolibacter yonseiensis]|uniref:Uncharacterized protein n=1 Tax=Luteolibacter yonseiensis TaxID=1144680 RepID=A0A934R841_9BACT|nr:hypothetical protein [Luteolibacter yonseiensis]MBK1818042.1 hypothetical protein [Luteolibacter yonseiensis]
MKKTDFSRHGRTITIGILVIILSGVGGHLKGLADAKEDNRTRDTRPLASVATPSSEKARGPSEKDETVSVDKTYQRLWKAWKESPHPDYDPEASSEISRLVSNMSSSQIGEFLKSLAPGAEWKLRRIILSCWVLQDGSAALAYMGAEPHAAGSRDSMETTSMVMQWATVDPDAALAWVNDENLPPELKKRASTIRLNSLMSLMDTEPDRAMQELPRMEPADVSKQLQLWAGIHGKDPEVRKRLLDYASSTGDSGDIKEVRTILVTVLGEMDPEAARAIIDTPGLDAAERAALELAETVGRAKKDPQATFDEWLRKSDVSNGIPEPIVFAIGSWFWPEPEPAIKWLDGQPAGEKRDALYASSIPALAGFEHFDKAAGIATSIDTPALRATALQALDLRWSLVNHEAAEKWRQNLAPEDRTLLGK